jgi:hypothetical protein
LAPIGLSGGKNALSPASSLLSSVLPASTPPPPPLIQLPPSPLLSLSSSLDQYCRPISASELYKLTSVVITSEIYLHCRNIIVQWFMNTGIGLFSTGVMVRHRNGLAVIQSQEKLAGAKQLDRENEGAGSFCVVKISYQP